MLAIMLVVDRKLPLRKALDAYLSSSYQSHQRVRIRQIHNRLVIITRNTII